MVDVMPTKELDILHPKLSISYAVTAILIVVMILAVLGVGYWAFNKAKSVVTPAASDGSDF
jgi:uncharacterized membrane-anchored protein